MRFHVLELAAVAAIATGCGRILGFESATLAPDTAPPAAQWTAVAIGSEHVCGVRDGSLWCWGSNLAGELGLGAASAGPTPPTRVAIAGTVTDVAASSFRTCALTSDGVASCWGGRDGGFDAAPIALDSTWLAVPSPGGGHVCGVRTDHTLWCWGRNTSGELGVGTISTSEPPRQVGTAADWLSVSSGAQHTCGVRMGGTLWCWGSNAAGQLGTTSLPATEPQQVAPTFNTTWIAAVAGDVSTCGLLSDGEIDCWGQNSSGQLGSGVEGNDSAEPLPIESTLRNWQHLVLTRRHVCALTDTGDAWCWGLSNRGQVGLDGNYGAQSPRAMGSSFRAIAVGETNTCAITTAGELVCNGADGGGQLADGGTSSPSPVEVAAGSRTIVAGLRQTCAIDANGALACGGANVNGQLGDGTTTSRARLAPVTMGIVWGTTTSLGVGDYHACATNANSKLVCWGRNNLGQTGNGSSDTYEVAPMSVLNPLHTSQTGMAVTAGGDHACALDSGQKAICWGANDAGQVGDGTTTNRNVATAVMSTKVWLAIATGARHTCALNDANEVWCWGANDVGQLGGPPGDSSSTPVKVALPIAAERIAVGADTSCAIDQTGVASCWGRDPLVGGKLWNTLSFGTRASCGIDTSGRLWCAGTNSYGQLGDGTYVDHPMTEVSGNRTWQSVSVGDVHVCGVTTDGHLYCWGHNDAGQLLVLAWSTAFVTISPP